MKQDVVLDYIKGLAILMVIVIHSVIKYNLKLGSILHIEQAVPLFLTVTAYLYFLKSGPVRLNEYYGRERLMKLVRRIFVPYLIFELMVIGIQIVQSSFNGSHLLLSGGIGMGSYYPWLYFQFWMVLPLFHWLLTKFKRVENAGIAMIVVSALIELLFAMFSKLSTNSDLFDSVWRLFIGRYVFIIFIAYLLVNDKFKLKYMLIPLLIGVGFTLVHRYRIIDLFPWFYATKTYSWNGVHWPMFFYSGFVFVLLYAYLPQLPEAVKRTLSWLGRNSWELFLAQMLFFSIFTVNDMPLQNVAIKTVELILCGVGFSVLIAFAYKWLVNRIMAFNLA